MQSHSFGVNSLQKTGKRLFSPVSASTTCAFVLKAWTSCMAHLNGLSQHGRQGRNLSHAREITEEPSGSTWQYADHWPLG